MTVVRGAALSPWTAKVAPEPEAAGLPKSVWRAFTAPVEVVTGCADVATGGREFVTGADRVAGLALECDAARADA